MNIIQYGKQLREFVSPFLDLILLSKPFHYTVNLLPQDCIERLRGLSQPKTGFFFYPISRAVKITQEVNHSKFEICVERYGRASVYNSAKANGIVISTNDREETTDLKGNLRLGIIFLVFPTFLLVLFIFNLNDLARFPGFYILAFVVSLFYIICCLRDYRRLDSLIRDTFSDANRGNN